jgi:hypothetical protein
MTWTRPVGATVAIEQLAHARYGTDPVPTLAVTPLALSGARRITVVGAPHVPRRQPFMFFGAQQAAAHPFDLHSDDAYDSDEEFSRPLSHRRRPVPARAMPLAEAVRFLAAAPLNVSAITVGLRGVSTEVQELARALRASPCHCYLKELHLPFVNGPIRRWPLTVADAAALIDATGGVLHLRSLTAGGPAAGVLYRATCRTLRTVAIDGSEDAALDLAACAALRRVARMDNCVALTFFAVPRGVTSFGDSVLHGAESLVRLDLSESQVRTIGNYCLARCPFLTTAVFPATLESVGDNALAECPRLEAVDFSHTALQSVGPRLCYCCARLRTARFPATLRGVGGNPFFECHSLRRVALRHTALSLREQERVASRGLGFMDIARPDAYGTSDSHRSFSPLDDDAAIEEYEPVMVMAPWRESPSFGTWADSLASSRPGTPPIAA